MSVPDGRMGSVTKARTRSSSSCYALAPGARSSRRQPGSPPNPGRSGIVDVPLPHRDRLFDYAVLQDLADAAQPGVRVRIRFAGHIRGLPGSRGQMPVTTSA